MGVHVLSFFIGFPLLRSCGPADLISKPKKFFPGRGPNLRRLDCLNSDFCHLQIISWNYFRARWRFSIENKVLHPYMHTFRFSEFWNLRKRLWRPWLLYFIFGIVNYLSFFEKLNRRWCCRKATTQMVCCPVLVHNSFKRLPIKERMCLREACVTNLRSRGKYYWNGVALSKNLPSIFTCGWTLVVVVAYYIANYRSFFEKLRKGQSPQKNILDWPGGVSTSIVPSRRIKTL